MAYLSFLLRPLLILALLAPLVATLPAIGNTQAQTTAAAPLHGIHYRYNTLIEYDERDLSLKWPALNNQGMAAWVVRRTGSGDELIAATDPLNPVLVGSLNARGTFNDLALNDAGQIATQDRQLNGISDYWRISRWNIFQPLVATIVARASADQDVDAEFGLIGPSVAINNSGATAFVARDGRSALSDCAPNAPCIVAEDDDAILYPFYEYDYAVNVNVTVCSILNDGRVLAYDGQIVLYSPDLSQREVIASNNLFDAIGNRPSISEDGTVVFYGELKQGAFKPEDCPRNCPDELGTPGPGIFASIVQPDGSRRLIRLTNRSIDGGLAGPIAWPELGYATIVRNNGVAIDPNGFDPLSYDLTKSVLVTNTINNGFVVAFYAKPRHASRDNPAIPGEQPLSFSDQPGWWSIRVDALRPLTRESPGGTGPLSYLPTSPRPIMQLGDQILSRSGLVKVTSLGDVGAGLERVAAAGNIERTIRAGDHRFVLPVTHAGGTSLLVAEHLDSDQDGLLDHWETNGIDMDRDGVIDLDLPALGALPNRRDLFLEIDWAAPADQTDYAPPYQAITELGFLFARAPEPITLHVDAGITRSLNIGRDDESTVDGDLFQGGDEIRAYLGTPSEPGPSVDIVTFGRRGSVQLSDGIWLRSLNDIKQFNFGTTDKWARNFAFHYAVFANTIKSELSEPFPPVMLAERNAYQPADGFTVPGNDILIGIEGARVVQNAARAGANYRSLPPGYLHYRLLAQGLGANFGLREGGTDVCASVGPFFVDRYFPNCYLPNYVSLMNSAYTIGLSERVRAATDAQVELTYPSLQSADEEVADVGGEYLLAPDNSGLEFWSITANDATAVTLGVSENSPQAPPPGQYVLIVPESFSDANDQVFNDWANMRFDFTSFADHLENSYNLQRNQLDPLNPSLAQVSDEISSTLTYAFLEEALGPFDKRLPTAEFTSPRAGASYGLGSSIPLDISASDDSAVAVITASLDLDGDGQIGQSEQITLTQESVIGYRGIFRNLAGPTGQRTLRLEVTDAADRVTTLEQPIVVTNDPPVTPTATTPPPGNNRLFLPLMLGTGSNLSRAAVATPTPTIPSPMPGTLTPTRTPWIPTPIVTDKPTTGPGTPTRTPFVTSTGLARTPTPTPWTPSPIVTDEPTTGPGTPTRTPFVTSTRPAGSPVPGTPTPTPYRPGRNTLPAQQNQRIMLPIIKRIETLTTPTATATATPTTPTATPTTPTVTPTTPTVTVPAGSDPIGPGVVPPGGGSVLGLDRILAIDLNAAGTQALVGGSSGLAALVDPDTLAVQLRLEGHTGPVNAVALAPDGSLAATGGEDGSVRIWELPSGRQLRVLVGHDGPLQALAFSGDGAGGLRLLSGSAVRNLSQTRNALLWEPRSGTLLRELNGHTNSVVAVDLSADGSRAMTGSFDDTARLWNTSDGTTLRTFGGNGGDVNAVAITADGSQAITGSGTTIRSYNLAGSGLRIINNAHGFAVRALAYTGDGTRFISGGTGGAGNRSGEVKVWSATGELQLTLEGHTQPVRTVLARGANQAISAGEDGVIRRWDSRLPQLRTLNHPPAVNTAAVSPDGTMLLTGGTDLVARLWDVASGNELRSFDGHTAAVSSVGFAPDSAYGISGGSLDRTAIIWNLATGDPATVIGHPVNAFVNTVNFFPNSVQDSPDQYRILTGAADGNLRIWSWNVLSTTATLERTIRQPGNPAPAVTAAAISKYGRWIASAGNGVISLWDRDGNLIRSFSGHSPQAISSLAFTDDELHLVSGASDYTARIWTLENGASRIFRTGLNTDQFVRSVAISSDGSRLLVGNGNQGYLIDVASGEPLLTLRGHTGPVQAVAFVGTSELLTASADGAIRLTTTGGAALSVVPGGHTDRVTSLDYNADGSRLLSASWDGSLRIWDMVNRTLERTLRGHSGFAHVAQWSADGRFILSGTLNREIFLWDVASGAIVQQFGTATGGATPYGLALSPDGSLVAAGRDNSILIYDATTGALARTLHVHSGVVNSLAFLPNGNLVSGSGDGSALVVDPSQEGVILASLGGSNGPVEAVAVSNDGSRIALGDRDGASIWQADGQLVRRFPSGEGSAKVVQVAFAPDGSQLLAARSNAAELWDVGSGALLRAFEQHLPEVASVAYHPNGLQVASGGARGDNSVRLWEVKVSAPQGGDLLGHEQGIQAIAFSSDGQEVLTGSSYSKWVERDCCPPPS